MKMMLRERVSITAEAGRSTSRPAAPRPVGAGSTRRALLSSLVITGMSVATGAKAETFLKSQETFLKSVGVSNLLTEKEEELFRLRVQQEGQALKELQAQKEILELEAAASQNGKLCATPFGVDIVGITELIALIGATVGGVAARQRKDEVERLNEQLRKINLSLRVQARAGTVYAPGLTYAPPGSLPAAVAEPMAAPSLPPVAPPAAPTPAAPIFAEAMGASYLSMDEEQDSTEHKECREALKLGKRLLKEKNGAGALVRFEKALMMSKALGDKVQERRAVRGLAAASRIQGQYKKAIGYLERVLAISSEISEFTGDADAYGTIADCYTDLGNFEKAAIMYDKYIHLMGTDGPSSQIKL